MTQSKRATRYISTVRGGMGTVTHGEDQTSGSGRTWFYPDGGGKRIEIIGKETT